MALMNGSFPFREREKSPLNRPIDYRTEYFVFDDGERPHQSLAHKTPDIVYRSAIGGGAVIVDKFPRAVEDIPVPLRSTGDYSTIKTSSEATGAAPSSCDEVECAA